MKLSHYLDRYLLDNEYSITIKNNMVHIMNYLELEDFSTTKVVVKYESGLTTLIGSNLVVSKMLRDELVIVGNIHTINV